MKLKYLLTIGSVALFSMAQAQTPAWQYDTIQMGTGYANNVYYSLNSGSVKTVANDSWDIAIRTDLMATGVYANHAAAHITVYPLTGISAATHFGTDLTTDTVGFTTPDSAIYNSIKSWDTGAFNQNRDLSNIFDLGWGVYNPTTHLVAGDKIYLLSTPTANYQLWIESDDPFVIANPPTWTIHIANLDGTNRKDITHHSNPTYTNKLMAYYNIAGDSFLNLDPDNSAWDFMFTRYTEKVSQGPVTLMYPVTGVLSNRNRPSLGLMGMDAVNAVWNPSLLDSMTDDISNIGREWKLQTQTAGVYDLDTATYFMKDAQNAIWQLEFTYATVGTATAGITPGEIVLKKRKVQSPTAIQNVNSKLSQVALVPNPATNTTTILLDAKANIAQSTIMITDISGRVLMQRNQAIQKGLQQIKLNIANYPSGMYFVSITADGYKTALKLIVK